MCVWTDCSKNIITCHFLNPVGATEASQHWVTLLITYVLVAHHMRGSVVVDRMQD